MKRGLISSGFAQCATRSMSHEGYPMDLINWLPSVTTTSLLALALWLCRKLIETRLTNGVEHEFNSKLEGIRAEFRQKEELLKADLRSKEIEIAALRSGAMTAMASRQVALDKRRLEAVDELWSAVTSLGRLKFISSLMAAVKFEVVAERAANNSTIREVFAAMGAGLDPDKVNVTASARARPFVSPMAWALFSAYQAILIQSVAKLEVIKSGVGAEILKENDGIAKLLKVALPHRGAFIEKFGDAGYHRLLDEIEIRLLEEMQKMLAGAEADKASPSKAAKILTISNDLFDSAQRSRIPLQEMHGRAPM